MLAGVMFLQPVIKCKAYKRVAGERVQVGLRPQLGVFAGSQVTVSCEELTAGSRIRGGT